MSQALKASEVQTHNTRKSLWLVIKNDVYDVTPFLDEHPGGEDPLLEAGGLDATTAFEDVGHSADARSLLKKYKVGTLAPGEKCFSKTARACVEKVRKRCNFKKPLQGSSSIPTIPKKACKTPSNPKVIPRVPSIVVPYQRRGAGSCYKESPPSGGKLKWVLLALTAVLVAGFVYHKYS